MADARHQVFIDLTTERLFAAARGGLPLLARFKYGSIGIERFLDQPLGLVDAFRDLRLHHSLSREAFYFDIDICGDDDTLAMLDLFIGQEVFRSARAAGLHLDGDAHFFSFVLESLLRHIGMRDSRGTGGNREDARESLDRLGLVEFCAFRVVDDFQEFFNIFRRDELVFKVLIHQHFAQPCEHIEVDIVFAVRGSDQEEQLHRFSVQRLVFDAIGDDHCGKGGLCNDIAFAMRNRDAFADARG